MTPVAQNDRTVVAEDPAMSAAIQGAGLPETAERHLTLAALAYSDGPRAEAHLLEAQAIAPAHAAVLIGLYRFYFYKHRLADALEVARICVKKAALDNGIPLDWSEVRAGEAAFGDCAAALPRFYLFALKACAYLSMRLGDLAEGRAMVAKLLELDPGDKIGAKVLLGILDRIGVNDDE